MDRQRITARMVTAASEDQKKKKKDDGQHRELDGFEYDKSKAKILKDALHNMNVALGTLISAMKDLAILRGSDITPDGKIGGRGFIMEFKEIKTIVHRTIEDLSNVTDSIADELTNPKWNLKEKEKEIVKEEQEEVVEQKEDMQEETAEGKKDNQELKQDPDEKGVVFEEVVDEDGKSEIKPEDVKDASTEFLSNYHALLGDKAADKVASVLSKRVLACITINGK